MRNPFLIAAVAGLLVVLAVVGVLAIDNHGGEEQKVRNTVRAYGRAAAVGDGDTACALLTPRSRRSVANGDSKRCPQVVAADAKRHSAEERAISVKGIEEAELDVKIEGNRATVTSTDTYPVRLEK